MTKIDQVLSKTSVTYRDCCTYWRNVNPKTVEDYTQILDNFNIVFICNSCTIEGEDISCHDSRELFGSGVIISYHGDYSSLLYAHNHRILLPTMLSDVVKKRQLTGDTIKKYHKILMVGLCRDIGFFFDDVEKDLLSLLDDVNDVRSNDIDSVIVAAAYFHAAFEHIHPFYHGNGYMGRLLMNYYLMQHDCPPIVIYNEDKETYYLALEEFDKTDKIDGMVKFIKEQMTKTWVNRIRR